MIKIKYARLIFLIIIAMVIVISLFIPSFRDLIINIFSSEGLEDLKNYIESLGYWGPFFAVFLMVLHSIVFIPSEIILFANVYIYGFTLGLLYTWIGSMLGAYLSFYLARFFGRPLVEKFVSKEKLDKFDQWFTRNGTFGLFILRLIPIFSFNLLNYGAGLVSMTFWQFTWSTAIGIIPPMIVMAWLYINSLNNIWGFIILLVMVVVFVLLKLFNKKYELYGNSRRGGTS
jgi:uncharacterized membrane protein YdjX (TVP38/TMEM64 family)